MPDQGEHVDEATDADEAVMGLLHEHVPLTLLVDLVDAPASEQVLLEEGIPDEPWWEGSTPADRPDADDAAAG
ncbi:hypothetical protein [Jannaschia sp. R86511]|uniref:hypothetical protein n=1 Tax=Jannaschia sp. R86511 TaxID=3093853 RepID=UPI0036D39903